MAYIILLGIIKLQAFFKLVVKFVGRGLNIYELSSQYDVHVNQIQTWRNQLKDNMVSLFDSGIDQRKDHEEQIKSLQAKIGQLTMENDFLATVLKP